MSERRLGRCSKPRFGERVLNPPGVWHTADVHEPGDALFITPGEGTEHKPR